MFCFLGCFFLLHGSLRRPLLVLGGCKRFKQLFLFPISDLSHNLCTLNFEGRGKKKNHP